MSKEPGSLVQASVEVDAIKGKVAVAGEVSQVEKIVQAFRSPKAKVQHAMAERLAAHLTDGKPLSEMTPMEQALLLEAHADAVTKGMNRRQVVERALKHDPGIAGLLTAPEAPKENPPPEKAAAEADEKTTILGTILGRCGSDLGRVRPRDLCQDPCWPD